MTRGVKKSSPLALVIDLLMSQRPHIYTPQEANRIIHELMGDFPHLRSIRDEVIGLQNKVDVEEITSLGSTGQLAKDARRTMDGYHRQILLLEKEFQKKLKRFEQVGCELKALDPGLVDFYGQRDNELIYLCWKEGEDEIVFWHTLNGGFRGRQPLR